MNWNDVLNATKNTPAPDQKIRKSDAEWRQVLTPEQWEAPLAKGKTVRNQFAHIHNVRLMWVKASAPALEDP